MWIILCCMLPELTSFISASQYNYPYVSPSVSYNLPSVAGRNYVFGPDGGTYTSNKNLIGSAITTGTYGTNTGNLVSHDQGSEYAVGSSATKFPGNIGNILGGGIGQFLRNAGNFWSGGNTGLFGGGGGSGYAPSGANNAGVKSSNKPAKAVSSSASPILSGVGNSGSSSSGKPSAVDSAVHFFGGNNPGSVADPGNVRVYGTSSAKVPGGIQGKFKSSSSIKSSDSNTGASSTKKHTRGNRSGNLYTDWNSPTFDETEVIDTEPYNKYFSGGWSSEGLHIPESSPPVSAPLAPIVRKHIYVHLPPTDAESKPSVPLVPIRAPEKHYRIVFIKAPSAPILTAPPVERNSEKTLIYVLFNKPEDYQIRLPDRPEPTEPTKPEVFFIRYKNPEEEAGKIGKGENEKKEVQSVEDDSEIGDNVFTGGYTGRPLW